MFARFAFRLPRFVSALAVAAAAIGVVGLLSYAGAGLRNVVTLQALTFYGITAGAYAALPFVRRGDVLMGAIWLVLVAGVAPCVVGEEISAPQMFGDIGGVLMAAIPIYIARLRQLAQGDTRPFCRRQVEREVAGGLDGTMISGIDGESA